MLYMQIQKADSVRYRARVVGRKETWSTNSWWTTCAS